MKALPLFLPALLILVPGCSRKRPAPPKVDRYVVGAVFAITAGRMSLDPSQEKQPVFQAAKLLEVKPDTLVFRTCSNVLWGRPADLEGIPALDSGVGVKESGRFPRAEFERRYEPTYLGQLAPTEEERAFLSEMGQ